MRLYDIIKKPILTEKTSSMWLHNATYSVVVSSDATKIDVKKAIIEIYWLEVESINIVNTIPKFKNSKKWIVYRRRSYKKAYITLKDKSKKIDFSILK